MSIRDEQVSKTPSTRVLALVNGRSSLYRLFEHVISKPNIDQYICTFYLLVYNISMVICELVMFSSVWIFLKNIAIMHAYTNAHTYTH